MARSEATVEELVAMIGRGELRLPEMQRQYVWTAPRVRDLFDSLYRGYPSGAILMWETDDSVPSRDLAVEQQPSVFQTTKLLLDGQQRLTSLSAILAGKPIERVRGRKRPIELLFNLDHPEGPDAAEDVNEDEEELDPPDASEDELQQRFDRLTFVVASKKLAARPNWVNVGSVLKTNDNTPFLRRAGLSNWEDPRFEKYTQRLNRLREIKKYVYRIDSLERGLSYEEVTEIFVRVNSLGAKLRKSDLAFARITTKWPKALNEFQRFQKECADLAFPLDLGIHVRNLVAFATGQSRFRTVGRQTADQLQDGWKKSREGLTFAINFLRSNLGIESPALLSSDFLLVALAYAGHKSNYHLAPADSAELRYWTLVANAKGRYSRGSSETLLDQDLARLSRAAGFSELVELLTLQFGRLDIDPKELVGRNARSSLFKTMFLAFRQAGARDWTSNLAISIGHGGRQHALQFHHIFPHARLKGRYRPHEINDIANLAFIGGKTNRRIGQKLPSEYFPTIIADQGPAAFDAQCIPTEASLLEIESYPAFLIERRQRIAQRLNEFLSDARRSTGLIPT